MKPGIELVRLIAVILITFTHTRNNLESGFTYFIVEELPKYGTAILSIISGYLYYTISRHKTGLFDKKIKSLVIPYLIANFSILFLVLIFNYGFGYNPLNRLSYDWSIVLEGLFSLNSPPINPPTYFIRDIFILFLDTIYFPTNINNEQIHKFVFLLNCICCATKLVDVTDGLFCIEPAR